VGARRHSKNAKSNLTVDRKREERFRVKEHPGVAGVALKKRTNSSPPRPNKYPLAAGLNRGKGRQVGEKKGKVGG